MNLQQAIEWQQQQIQQELVVANGNPQWRAYMEANPNVTIDQSHVNAFHLDVSVHSPMSHQPSLSVSSTPSAASSSNPSRSFVAANGTRSNRLGSFHTPHSTTSTPTSNSIHSTPSRHAKRVREDEDEPLSARAINFGNQMSDLMIMSTSPMEGEFNQQRQDGTTNHSLVSGETFRPPKMQKLSLQISPSAGVNSSYSAANSPFVASNNRAHFPSASQPTSVSASPNLFPLNETPFNTTAGHLPPTHVSVFASIVNSPSSPFVQQQNNNSIFMQSQHQPLQQLPSPNQLNNSFSSIPPPIPLVTSARQQSLPVISSFAFNQMQNGNNNTNGAAQNHSIIHQQQQQEQHRQEQILQLRELQRQYHQQQQQQLQQQMQQQQQQQLLSVPFRPASAPLFNGNGGRPVQSIVSPDNMGNNPAAVMPAEVSVNSMEEQDEVAHPSTPSCNSPSHCSSTASLTQLARNYSANESSGSGSGRGVRGMIPNLSTVSIPSSLQSSHPTSPSEPASRSYMTSFRSSSPTELAQSVSLSASTASFPANYAAASHLAVHGGGVAASELHSPASSSAMPIHAPLDIHSGYMGGVEIGQGILIMNKCRGLSPTNAANVDGLGMASSPRANGASHSPRGHKRTVTSVQQFVLNDFNNTSSDADGMED